MPPIPLPGGILLEMKENSKALITAQSVLIVPVAAIISMYAAITGASAAGLGGARGWGYILAVPGGPGR
jgi:hypothetical protein